MRKELKDLKEGSEEYLAIVKKYEALNKIVVAKSTEEQVNIRKKGWSDIVTDIENEINLKRDQDVIKKGGKLSEIEEGDLKIQSLNQQIAALNSYGSKLQQNTTEYQEYVNERIRLESDLTIATEEQANRRMEKTREEKEKQLELLNAVGDAVFAIGGAFAANIEDEKERIKIEQALAVAQVLLNQGIAISEAVASAAAGDPYTIAIRIAAAVAAITSSIVAATQAINQSKAVAYEHGTDYHTGGYAVVGEGKKGNEYKPEIVFAGGKKYLFDQPTFLKDLPVGAQVKPLEDWINSNSFDFYQTPMDKETASQIIGLLSEIKNKPIVNIDVGQNIYSHIIRGANRTRILNQRFRA